MDKLLACCCKTPCVINASIDCVCSCCRAQTIIQKTNTVKESSVTAELAEAKSPSLCCFPRKQKKKKKT